SITKDEQGRRFEEIRKTPSKRWKLTEVDEESRRLWDEYTVYKKKMFEQTNTDHAPWKIIDANNKPKARLEVINHILDIIPYND
ncbi:MAG: polyphosphate kinase 2, partial [Candidatus Kapaibacterium sp.]